MDFDVGGLPRAQNRPVAAKIIDFGVCELVVDGSGIKTRPRAAKTTDFDVGGLLWRAPSSKQAPGCKTKRF